MTLLHKVVAIYEDVVVDGRGPTLEDVQVLFDYIDSCHARQEALTVELRRLLPVDGGAR